MALGINFALIAYAILRGLVKAGHPARYFSEGRFITAFSCLQLFMVAGIALLLYLQRRQDSEGSLWKNPASLWLLISAGFCFLVFDEALEIHERIDKWIHQMFGFRETGWTDRFDDALIGVYALIGLGVLWHYRSELMRFKTVHRYLAPGFGLTFISILCDGLSNREDVLSLLPLTEREVERWYRWIEAVEGGTTVLAEALFVTAFYAAWHAEETVRRRRATLPALPQPALSQPAPMLTKQG